MWTHKNTFAIGGLRNVGYAENKDILMVLSAQGQGIFDCRSGEKLARIHNDLEWIDFDDITNSIAGFDCLEGEVIATSGLFGGDHLLKTTNDGWSLIVTEPISDRSPFGAHLIRTIYIFFSATGEQFYIAQDGPCELRAFEFSETGNSFIVATRCELIIYSRNNIVFS